MKFKDVDLFDEYEEVYIYFNRFFFNFLIWYLIYKGCNINYLCNLKKNIYILIFLQINDKPAVMTLRIDNECEENKETK